MSHRTTPTSEPDEPNDRDDSEIGDASLSDLFGLDPPVSGPAGPDPLIGEIFGDARIIRLLGSGGMGRVYEAFQDQLGRTVAVKVMRPGLATPEMQKRFKLEALVIARLEHPGIARIYGAGVRDWNGATVPYFVMQLIPDAHPITDYAFERKLSTKERLALFRGVCDAVAHGHQKGVIHRDLKPSNILVDANGEPKVIDFGVAKVTDSDLALTTMQTDVGQLIGTLHYMGPEQIAGRADEIDVRCDVYALGVVLYELLAGRMPYDLEKKALLEVMRIVREEEPVPLSSLDKGLRRDVAVIVGKCLQKERSRRYSSASELSADLGRHLAGEPIKAKPQSFLGSVVRVGRKHKATTAAMLGAAVAATVMALLVWPRPVVPPSPDKPALNPRWIPPDPRANGGLGTVAENERFVITKARLLEIARTSVPAAVDVQDLVVAEGRGDLSKQLSLWDFRPTPTWAGQVVFSYTIVTKSPAGQRVINGLNPSEGIVNSLNGSARFTPDGLLLTDATPYQVGSAFLATKLDLTRDFTTSFRLGLSGGTGGDGIALVIHDDPRGVAMLGEVGGGMGYYGLGKSIGVEFDTCVGFHPADTQVGADHVGIMVDGAEVMEWQANPAVDLRADDVHAWIEYSAREASVRVYVSGTDKKPDEPLFTFERNLAASVGRDAYIGFSAATGTMCDRHIVRDWRLDGSFSGAAMVPGRATLTVESGERPPPVSATKRVFSKFAVPGVEPLSFTGMKPATRWHDIHREPTP